MKLWPRLQLVTNLTATIVSLIAALYFLARQDATSMFMVGGLVGLCMGLWIAWVLNLIFGGAQ